MNTFLTSAGRTRRQRGFALIITLSMMVLLTIIALGFLSLSTISLRAASQSTDMAIARSNAKMALMLAIGELQKNAGPDTRITAKADLVDPNNPPVLGVWKSWEGTDHLPTTGLPTAPDYSNHKKARFLEWLTSAPVNNDLAIPPSTVAGSAATLGGTQRVSLVGPGTVGTILPNQRQIFLDPVGVQNAANTYSGSYAWWVSGENQKARLPKPYEPSSSTPSGWALLSKSHSVADPSTFGLNTVLSQGTLSDPTSVTPALKAVSIKQSDLIGAGTAVSQTYFHDLSTTASGLLTNSATGGWRKDLSLASENWSSLSSTPMFRALPTKDLIYGTATSSDYYAKHSLPYYWCDYRRSSGNAAPIYNTGAVCSWTNLVNYALLYKNQTPTTSGPSVNITRFDIWNGPADYLHSIRLMPLIARVQWIFSHRAVQGGTSAAPTYALKLVVQPVITLWNPYNVKIAAFADDINLELHMCIPPVLDYKVGGQPIFPSDKFAGKVLTLQGESLVDSANRGIRGVTGPTTYQIKGGIDTLAPGETRVFTIPPPTSANPAPTPGVNPVILKPGYTAGNGVEYDIGTISKPGSSAITTGLECNCEYNDPSAGGNAIGVGMYMDMRISGTQVMAYRMSYKKSLADAAYPPISANKLPAPTLAQVASSIPTPFLSVMFGTRMASNTNLPSKGFVQSSPFVSYTAMGLKSQIEPGLMYAYPGVGHNVNSPFEYSFKGLTANDPVLPDVGANNRGFIMTGFKVATGLSRCVIGELPTRPLCSLGELQGWDARFDNPVPPFSYNLIANSDATPLIPSANVSGATLGTKGEENMQFDDSYCLNHVLFDDWFVSSIATDPAAFGAPPASSNPRKVYTDFLTVPAKPLANRAYKALPADISAASVSSSAATTVATKNVGTAATSWKTIASRLEVEGMFNVNSTSVKAWRALLGHARNERVPYEDANGNPALSGPTDYAFSRLTVAGDVECTQAGSSGARPDAAQFTGYRVFTEKQLDFLSTEIVNQVRLRGPFLSLSEFVNRQLSSGDLALAGAIQTALNKLAANTALNPYQVLQTSTSSSSNISATTPAPTTVPSEYTYPEAAQGYSLYGLPGWTRQADVLRQLAPILSVRDDTFTIRAYGDARDASGKTVKARAVCEATVRRSKDFVDPTDDAATADLSNSTGTVNTKQQANMLFGRRFEVVSFRWLSTNDI